MDKNAVGAFANLRLMQNNRDDKGYWTQIEGYIQAHSDAQFSHAICPAWAKKLYSDLEVQLRIFS